MKLEKTLLCSILGVTALFAQAGAPQPAKRLSARDLFYAPTQPAAQKAPARPAKQAAPKKAAPAGETPAPATEPLAGPSPADRAVPPPVSSGGAQIVQAGYAEKPLGLRYSILRNNGDDYREAAPDTVFHSGDRIRVAVEANDAGYLYVAMKGASGAWKILFPTAEIAGGNNRVESGRQYTIPSPPGRFAFDQQAGEEQIFIVLSRQPEPSLEQLIYSLGSGNAPPAKAPPSPGGRPLVLAQAGPIGDSLVSRLRGEVYARDLVFEKVDDSTPSEKKENAVYVVNRTGGVDSRLVADFVLKHQ